MSVQLPGNSETTVQWHRRMAGKRCGTTSCKSIGAW